MDYPKSWPSFGAMMPVAELQDLPNWIRRPSWFDRYWYEGFRALESYTIDWPHRARQVVNSLRFIVTYLVLDGLWLLTTILLIGA